MTRIGRVGKAVCADAALAASRARPAPSQPMRLAAIASSCLRPSISPGSICRYRIDLSALDVEQSMDFDLSERSREWRDRLQTFFEREVLPRHRDWAHEVAMARQHRSEEHTSELRS